MNCYSFQVHIDGVPFNSFSSANSAIDYAARHLFISKSYGDGYAIGDTLNKGQEFKWAYGYKTGLIKPVKNPHIISPDKKYVTATGMTFQEAYGDRVFTKIFESPYSDTAQRGEELIKQFDSIIRLEGGHIVGVKYYSIGD